jgi:hypothetical protein
MHARAASFFLFKGKKDRRDFLQMLLDAEAVDDMLDDRVLTMTEDDQDEAVDAQKDRHKPVRLLKKITNEVNVTFCQ